MWWVYAVVVCICVKWGESSKDQGVISDCTASWESQIETWKTDLSEENKFIMTSLKSLWMEQEIRVKEKIKEVKGRGFMLHFAVYTLFKDI